MRNARLTNLESGVCFGVQGPDFPASVSGLSSISGRSFHPISRNRDGAHANSCQCQEPTITPQLELDNGGLRPQASASSEARHPGIPHARHTLPCKPQRAASCCCRTQDVRILETFPPGTKNSCRLCTSCFSELLHVLRSSDSGRLASFAKRAWKRPAPVPVQQKLTQSSWIPKPTLI